MNATGEPTSNAKCHCEHLDQVTARVNNLEVSRAQIQTRVTTLEAQRGQGHETRRSFLEGNKMPDLRHDAEVFIPETQWDGKFLPEAPMSKHNGFTGNTQLGMLNGDKYNERPLYDDKSA